MIAVNRVFTLTAGYFQITGRRFDSSIEPDTIGYHIDITTGSDCVFGMYITTSLYFHRLLLLVCVKAIIVSYNPLRVIYGWQAGFRPHIAGYGYGLLEVNISVCGS